MPKAATITRNAAIVIFAFLLVTVILMVANPTKVPSGLTIPECAGPGESTDYPCVITEDGYHILRLSSDGWVII